MYVNVYVFRSYLISTTVPVSLISCCSMLTAVNPSFGFSSASVKSPTFPVLVVNKLSSSIKFPSRSS